MQIPKVFKEHNVSLSEVARRMGISKGTLSDAIRRDNMHTETLRRIAKAAGCNVSEFFADEDSPTSEMPQKANKGDFTVLIDAGGQLYRADSLNQLETFILAFEPKEKTIQAKQNDMKAKIVCRTLGEVRENIFALCKEYGVKADRVFLPGNFDNTNNMGIAYAVNDKNVVAASPYWRTEDGLIEIQADLLKVSKMICTAPLSPKKDAVSELDAESEGSFKGEDAGTAHNEEKPSKIALQIKERGLTVTEVAKRMGVFPTSLSRIIHNGTNRQSTLKSIAEAIGCNIEDLKD